jgi:hypothetical protein
MKSPVKPKTEVFIRVILTIVVLFNAIIPTTAFAMPPNPVNASMPQANDVHDSLPISVEPAYDQLNVPVPNPERFSPQADEQKPVTPAKDPVEFSISTSKGMVDGNRIVTIDVSIRNNSEVSVDNLTYYDKLEKGLEFGSSADKLVRYGTSTGTVTYKIETLKVGEEAGFSYTIKVITFIPIVIPAWVQQK